MSWVTVAVAVVGTAVTAYNSDRTAKKQDQAAARGIRAQGKKQSEADAKVAQLIDQRKNSNSGGEQKGALDQFMQVLRANNAQSTSGVQQIGAVSGAARQASADASLGIGQYGSKVASLMSRIDAPMQSRRNDDIFQARTAGDLAGIKRNAEGEDFLARLRLQAIRRDPWLDAAGSAMTQYGTAKASAGGWGGG